MTKVAKYNREETMGQAVAKQRKATTKERRVEFRADPDWYDRVEVEARRLGLSVAAYLRVAAVEKMDRDQHRRESPERA